MVDKVYCMSSYLMYRYIFDQSRSFGGMAGGESCSIADITFPRVPVRNAEELLAVLKGIVERNCMDGKAVLALSGGIDSAILAKCVPEGTTAYTFRCVVPGKKVTDETVQAGHWAELCGLKHEIIDISWQDIARVSGKLMEHKGAPIHSIEAQIYIASDKAQKAGADRFIFGENADIIYGGMNGLLEKDWRLGEFIDRYTYVMPYKVLRNPRMILEPYYEFERNGFIDGYNFINKFFRQEALGTYQNACQTAGLKFVGPYSETYLAEPIDYGRIRREDTKYVVREVFRKLYPQEELPEKIPMPRPMDEWLKDWGGSIRPEFIPHCTDGMTGDQKWMVWALESFLNLLEEGEKREQCIRSE